jgi:hypothetical protein
MCKEKFSKEIEKESFVEYSGIFLKMEDDLKVMKMEDDLNFLEMKNNISF